MKNIQLSDRHRKMVRSLFSDISEAVSGSEQDFTEGRLGRAILLLSIPAVLEMVMESVFAIVDIFFVSRLGADSVATVGITESVMTIIYAISIGLGTATTSLVSRRIGEKKSEEASNTAFQAILIGLSASILIGFPGALYSRNLLSLMGATDVMVNQLSGYATLMLGGNIVIMMLFIINAIFRSAGDAAIAMKMLWLGNIINIILDPCLIFGLGFFPEMGVTGAALATVIGRGTAVLVQFYLLFFGGKRVQLKLRTMYINVKVMLRLLKLSTGTIGQNLIGTTSWVGLFRIVSIFGSAVIAGYTIALRIIGFTLMPSWGISNAASTLVGQNLGAGKPERAERSVWVTGWVNMMMLGIIGLVLILAPKFFIGVFISDEDVIRAGATGLMIISIGYIAYGLGMVIV
ncbi:MAG TPA: MATE family efflux transporter, partial [Bacteroidales bacterium]|nr:MATE family efflux transporter [Bacteroidales bacterium]